MRADARRNHEALVAAAREVFAADGLHASLDEIARRAGVANATLYRRFPDRCRLVEAVFVEQMADYAAAAARALDADDAWEGFAGFARHLCRLQAEDQGLSELLTTTLFDAEAPIAEQRRLTLDRVEHLIARARDEGGLRPDFTHQDLVVLLMANAGIVHRTRTHARGAWERHLAFVLDGLRDPVRPGDPPAPARTEIEAAMRERG